jgi:hypothetical protein
LSPLLAPSTPKRRRQHPSITAAANNSNSSSDNTWLSRLRARPPASAAALTGAYALIAGSALCAWPAATLAVIAPEAAAAVPAGWVRLGGLILATFGLQYAGASWHDCAGRCGAEGFYRASVPSRLALAAALALLVALGQVERGVLVLAALNATGALSMRRALQRAAAAAGGGRGR